MHDVRCIVSYLRSRDDVDSDKIDIVGFAEGGLVGLFAAVLEPGIRSVVSVGGVTTQAAAIRLLLTDTYFLYQPNLLPAGDVGVALSLLAGRKCKLICFQDDPDWPADGARKVAQDMRQAYAKTGSPEALAVEWPEGSCRMNQELRASVLDWLDGG